MSISIDLLKRLFGFDTHLHSNDMSLCARASVWQWRDFFRNNFPWVGSLVITNHSHPPGLFDSKIMDREVKLNDYNGVNGMKIHSGLEANILSGGDLDVSKRILENADWVMAAMNPLRIEYGEKRYIKRSASEIEKDMVKAMKSGMIDVIGHPTGNIEPEKVRKISWERIFDVARHQGVLIEVNLNEDIPEWWLSELAGSGNMISFGSDWHGMYQFRKFRPKEGVGPSESDLISRVNEGGRNSYDSLSSDEKESFDRIYTSSELDEDFFDWVGLEIRKVMNAGIAEGRIFNSRGSQFLDAFVKKPKNERRKYIANL